MRADRLISMLVLLQARGKMTAAVLAHELGVSVRTIYRDVDALSLAGFPLLAGSGAGGGISLMEDYRTSLTGLSIDEVSALFMPGIPAPLLQLGAGKNLKNALDKLLASLPERQRSAERLAKERIYLDAGGWQQSVTDPNYLQKIELALWQERKLRIITHTVFSSRVQQVVDVYGLVAKDGAWYLVAAAHRGKARVYRISQLAGVELLEDRFIRPADFDLPAFWSNWCREKENAPRYQATMRLSGALAAQLSHYFGEQASELLEQAGGADEQGWFHLVLPFENFFAARERILSWGRDAEVLAPQALRSSVIDFARQITAVYRD